MYEEDHGTTIADDVWKKQRDTTWHYDFVTLQESEETENSGGN